MNNCLRTSAMSVLLLLASDCFTDAGKEDPTTKIAVEFSAELESCLKEHADEENNQVNLAEDHCASFLPDSCLFGYGKAAYWKSYLDIANSFTYNGRDWHCQKDENCSIPKNGIFGVYCSAKFPARLEKCEAEIDYSSSAFNQGSDGFIIDRIYQNCWNDINDNCMFANIVEEPHYNMFYCLISSSFDKNSHKAYY